MSSRPLSTAERDLAAGLFGTAIDYEAVRINHAKWWPLHPRDTTMAPDGHLWFHPQGDLYCDDFGCAPLHLQSHFIHEMTHVWQAQRKGRWYLPLMRHPFCRYAYALEPGKPFAAYGIEQQAEIIRHAFLWRKGMCPTGAPARELLEAVLPFKRQS
ncbi:MAG: vgr related protein [Deltaproteobacteria bacterium]